MLEPAVTEPIVETQGVASQRKRELISQSAPGASKESTPCVVRERVRLPWRWVDLWEAPFHDFPVRDMILYQCVGIGPEESILEVGPGSGFTAFCLAPRVRRVTLLDVAEESIRDLKEKLERFPNVSFIRGDAAAASFAHTGGGFDLAFGLDVFEYVTDARGCLQNLAGALRPGGRLFLTYPNALPGTGDGVNYYARKQHLERLLDLAGFSSWNIYAVRPTRYAAMIYELMHEWPLKLYRRLRRDRIQGLPQTYESTWAFVHGKKLERYKPLAHFYWLLLGGVLRLGGDLFRVEDVDDGDIAGKQLVIEAWK